MFVTLLPLLCAAALGAVACLFESGIDARVSDTDFSLSGTSNSRASGVCGVVVGRDLFQC